MPSMQASAITTRPHSATQPNPSNQLFKPPTLSQTLKITYCGPTTQHIMHLNPVLPRDLFIIHFARNLIILTVPVVYFTRWDCIFLVFGFCRNMLVPYVVMWDIFPPQAKDVSGSKGLTEGEADVDVYIDVCCALKYDSLAHRR